MLFWVLYYFSRYCIHGDLVTICPEGYYCPAGTGVDWQQCPPGKLKPTMHCSFKKKCNLGIEMFNRMVLSVWYTMWSENGRWLMWISVGLVRQESSATGSISTAYPLPPSTYYCAIFGTGGLPNLCLSRNSLFLSTLFCTKYKMDT